MSATRSWMNVLIFSPSLIALMLHVIIMACSQRQHARVGEEAFRNAQVQPLTCRVLPVLLRRQQKTGPHVAGTLSTFQHSLPISQYCKERPSITTSMDMGDAWEQSSSGHPGPRSSTSQPTHLARF